MANITGTAGADILFGAAGADLITGGEDRDFLWGGAGDDTLQGGGGDDVLRGEAGHDVLEGGAGNDDLASWDGGNDSLYGGEGSDVLSLRRTNFFFFEAIMLDGGAGDDRISVEVRGLATANVAGGEGNDRIDIFSIQNALPVSLGAGADVVTLYNVRSTVMQNGRIDISDFQAGAGGDRLELSTIINIDFQNWNQVSNPFASGYMRAEQLGNDVVISFSFAANGTFTPGVFLRNVQVNTLVAENLGGWSWDGSAVAPRILAGTEAGETIRAAMGDDQIDGAGGDDVLEGGYGADLLTGGDGNDFLRGGAGTDQLHGGAGNDSLFAEGGDDVMYGNDGEDRLNLVVALFGPTSALLTGFGGAGNDTLIVSTSAGTIGRNYRTDVVADAGTGDDLVTVTALTGTASITLGGGRDRIDLEGFVKTPGNAIEITDFATGDSGDRIEFAGVLFRSLNGWNQMSDPVAGGFLRLAQSGADAVLEMDRDGGGDGFETLVTFRNASAAAFRAYNLGGYGAGAPPAGGQAIAGTADADRLYGTEGGDTLEGLALNDVLLGFGGTDTLRGGDGDDSLNGGDGDDILDGGAGNDTFLPGRGTDHIDGGEGNDTLNDQTGSGTKFFTGGEGNDLVSFTRTNEDQLIAEGGAGDDTFVVRGGAAGYTLDGGAGTDTFELSGSGTVTLGGGRDQIRFVENPSAVFNVTVTDFTVGDDGDRFSLASLYPTFQNFNPSANPFKSGHLMLSQSGNDTILTVDYDGATGAGLGFGTGANPPSVLARLVGVDKYTLTAANLAFPVPFVIGTEADETFQGGVEPDDFVGGGGNDVFLIGYGSEDVAQAGAGNDLFFFATGASGVQPGATINAGAGADVLQIQSKLASQAIVLTGIDDSSTGTIRASGIETVQFLSGYDASRGWARSGPVTYQLSIGGGFAPTGGAPLTVDTTLLAANEELRIGMFGIGDPASYVKLVGGAGIDNVHAGFGHTHLDGGAGNDILTGYVGDDVLLGGAGADTLTVNAFSGGSGADFADGGEGDDVLRIAGNSAFWDAVTMNGGTGNDIQIVEVRGTTNMPAVAALDLGEGDDRLELRAAYGTFNVTLGAGRDTIDITTSNGGNLFGVAGAGRTVVIRDFDTGSAGDVLVWQMALDNALSGGGYAAGSNPFHTGHARLVQDGADVLLQISFTANDVFATALRFEGRTVQDFAGGIGGFSPVSIEGTEGNDALYGTAAADNILGKGGDDLIDGMTGADRMAGGTGNDVYVVDNAGDRVVEAAGAGTDEIRTTLSSFSLVNAANVENLTGIAVNGQTLTGNGLANHIRGGSSGDILYGGAGNDLLEPGEGLDWAYGQEGDDVVRFSSVAAPGSGKIADGGLGFDTLDLSAVAAALFFGSANSWSGNMKVGDLTFSTFERVIGGSAGDTFFFEYGSSGELRGGGGDDYFLGNQMIGEKFFGEAGNDRFDVYASDIADGGEGDDRFSLNIGSGPAQATVIGGAGTDTIVMSPGTADLQAGTASSFGATYALSSIEAVAVRVMGSGTSTVFGSDGADTLSVDTLIGDNAGGAVIFDGRGGDDRLTGSRGNDRLTGGAGADRLEGRLGNDIYVVDDALDTIVENANEGTDEVRTGVVAFTLSANLETLTGLSATGQALTGNAAANVITGGVGNDVLDGGAGADTMAGGNGDDVYVVDDAGDVVNENSSGGTDEIRTALASYTLPGGGNAVENLAGLSATGQTLKGNDRANTIVGGAGDDVMEGSGNADLLVGGGGADRFVYRSVWESVEGSRDRIAGFEQGVDKIDLMALGLVRLSFVQGTDALGAYTLVIAKGAGTQELSIRVDGTIGESDILAETGIVGTPGDDTLQGTADADTIRGEGGNDTLSGLGAGDVLEGGAGNDRLDGGEGIDTMRGGTGDDVFIVDHSADTVVENEGEGTDEVRTALARYTLGANVERLTGTGMGQILTGNSLANRIEGTGIADTLYGEGGDDALFGGAGDDAFNGGGGNDVIDGGTGADVMGGLAGNDLFLVDDAGDRTIEAEGEGTDEVRTGLATYTLEANVENLTGTADTGQVLTGNGGNNLIVGGMGDDTIYGLGGDDIIVGFGGFDVMRGGAGDDVYAIDAGDTVIELDGEGVDEIRTVGAIFVLGVGLENLRATSDVGHDFRGNLAPNAIIGGDGNDIIRLQDGGGDVAFGKNGNDSFYFGGAFDEYDFIDGGDNRDSLILQGMYNMTLVYAPTGRSSIANVEGISLVSGTSTQYGQAGTSLYSYNLTLVDDNASAGALMKVNGFNLQAGENLTLNASAETDAPLQVFGGFGTETLTGGGQGDAFVFGHDGRFGAGDTVNGGGGYDIVYLRGDYTVDFNAAGFQNALTNVESIALLTSANTEFVSGGDGEFDYSITWADALLANGATFTVNGSRLQAHESFTFDGSQETNGVLRVFGGAAADTLTGGGGADQLTGGGGADVLTGGAGADLFRYAAATDSTAGATDTIHGFVAGTDKIDVNRVDAKASTADTNEAFAFIGGNAFSAAGPNAPGELRAFNVSENLWQVEGDVNGDGTADLVIQVHVDAGQPLTVADFVL
jgi:Ca2+-binding RTX toxin-like protein